MCLFCYRNIFRRLENEIQRISLETSPSSTTSKSSESSTELRASISRLFQTAIDAQDVNLITECDEAETDCNLSTGASECTGAEPIYAVVNLKKKYALRAQQKEVTESYLFRDRPNSVHVVSSDYEEVFDKNRFFFFIFFIMHNKKKSFHFCICHDEFNAFFFKGFTI